VNLLNDKTCEDEASILTMNDEFGKM